MNVTFACPACQQAGRVELAGDARSIVCPHCGQTIDFPDNAWNGRQLTRCLVCPSDDLFVRKDFPQRLGVGIVTIGFVASSVAWYYTQVTLTFGILFATALVDVLLFLLVGDALMCYRCQAQYRGVSDLESHDSFSLETHERYRQLAARGTTDSSTLGPS